MSVEQKNISTQEFADRAADHRNALEIIDNKLGPELSSLIHKTRERVRESMQLNPDEVVVILGEQTYGLNGPGKVLGKRLFAKGVEEHGVQTVELFASYDTVGSEPGIYRMQLPHPHSPGGNISLNVLSGWKRSKQATTASFRAPTIQELGKMFNSIAGLYGTPKSEELEQVLANYYDGSQSYALANAELLKDFERQIGLEMSRSLTEDGLDTAIAQHGGMEIMLQLWPTFAQIAAQNPTEGVRIPDSEETPFHLYHTDNPECNSRMAVRFASNNGKLELDTQIEVHCPGCGHHEITNPQEIVDSGRPLTWRAIPRVVLYSAVGFDAHITGGGSIYNSTAQKTAEEIGIPYFPITHMNKSNGEEKEGIFTYDSASTVKQKGDHRDEAITFVKQGKAAMVDLALSVGTAALNEAIRDSLDNGLTTDSRVICPEILPKYENAFNKNE